MTTPPDRAADAERLAEIRAHVANHRVPSWHSPDWKQHYGWRQQDIELLLGKITSLQQERDDWLRRCATCVATKGKIMEARDTATRDLAALKANRNLHIEMHEKLKREAEALREAKAEQDNFARLQGQIIHERNVELKALREEIERLNDQLGDAERAICRAPYEDENGEHSCAINKCRIEAPDQSSADDTLQAARERLVSYSSPMSSSGDSEYDGPEVSGDIKQKLSERATPPSADDVDTPEWRQYAASIAGALSERREDAYARPKTSADDAPLSPVLRDWCEEHNRGSLPDGLCPECEARTAARRNQPSADDVERARNALGPHADDGGTVTLADSVAAAFAAARAQGIAQGLAGMREEAEAIATALQNEAIRAENEQRQKTLSNTQIRSVAFHSGRSSAAWRIAKSIRAIPIDTPTGQGDDK